MISYSDYRLLGYKIILQKDLKNYELFVDPRLKLHILRNNKKLKLSIKDVLVNDIYKEYKIISIEKPVVEFIKIHDKIQNIYPLTDLIDIKNMYKKPIILNDSQIQYLIDKYKLSLIIKHFSGLLFQVNEDVQIYLPYSNLGIKEAGIQIENELKNFLKIE